MEITVIVNYGSIAFSFPTDENGNNLENGFKAIKKLRLSASKIVGATNVTMLEKQAKPEMATQQKSGKGKAETSLITRKVEELLLPEYFSQARTTGEVRLELQKRTGIPFQSRKVSQSLGQLALLGKLGRTGSKDKHDFRYFRP